VLPKSEKTLDSNGNLSTLGRLHSLQLFNNFAHRWFRISGVVLVPSFVFMGNLMLRRVYTHADHSQYFMGKSGRHNFVFFIYASAC
jgi:hypothetical protein